MSENETSGDVQEAPAEARRRHADLSLEITEADHRYYILDSPTISDIDYDTKMRELRALEEQYPGPAHAGLADPDRARGDIHAVHPGRAPGAAAQPGQRVHRRGPGRLGRPRRPSSAAPGRTCVSSR